MERFVFVITLLLSFLSGISKEYDIKVAEHQAYEHFIASNYTSALPLYEKLHKIDSTNFMYNYPLGVCHLYQKNDSALFFLNKCQEYTDTLPPNYLYYLAKAHHINDHFEEAIPLFEEFLTKVEGIKNFDLEHYAVNAKKEIEQCNSGIIIKKAPHNFIIENLGSTINSSAFEYAPLISYDENSLIFTAEVKKSDDEKVDEFGRYTEDVFISKKVDSNWTTPTKIKNINTDGDDAAVFFSHCANTMLLYRFTRHAKFQPLSGNIYTTSLQGDSISDIEILPEPINSKYRESSACLSPDGRTVYFSSDRPGGFGGMDIYYATKRKDSTWSKAYNLGENINTPYDEESPFITPDNLSLFYCSNSTKSIGGFDFFFSHKDLTDLSWSVSENIGYPINTAHDDLYLEYSPLSNSIYFSAERHQGYGKDDIFHAVLEEELINKSHKCKIQFKTESGVTLPREISLAIDKSNKIISSFPVNQNGKVELFVSEKHDYFVLSQYKDRNSEIFNVGQHFECTDKDFAIINLD